MKLSVLFAKMLRIQKLMVFFSGKIPSFRLLNTSTKTVCRVWDEDHQAGKKVPVKSQLTASRCLFWAHGFRIIRKTKFVVDVKRPEGVSYHAVSQASCWSGLKFDETRMFLKI